MALASLFFCCDSESLHLAVEVAAFKAQDLSGPAYVAVIFVQLLQDVVALVGVAGLMQSREFRSRGTAAAITVNKGRQVFAFETRGGRIHDDDALDDVAQLADVAGPGVTH